MTGRKVVGRTERQAARRQLLQREKQPTWMGDELARQRRQLPWVAIHKEYRFDTDDGADQANEHQHLDEPLLHRGRSRSAGLGNALRGGPPIVQTPHTDKGGTDERPSGHR
jgi:hypothetical protein